MNSLDAWAITKDMTCLYAKADLSTTEYELSTTEYELLQRKTNHVALRHGGNYLPESEQQGELMLRRLLDRATATEEIFTYSN